jgi:hypothetical protein
METKTKITGLSSVETKCDNLKFIKLNKNKL